jgi:hypothetical protein
LVLSQQHRATDAVEEFRQALAIDPQLSAAREALSRLTSGK